MSNIKGIWLMTRSAAAFSAAVLCAKFASLHLPSLEIVFFRSLIGSLMLLALMIPRKISMLGGSQKGLMVLRGLFGFIALTLHFVTIAHLPLGLAVMLNYTSPILSAILAVLFLKERPGILLSIMTVVSFAGVYLLVGGSFPILNQYVVIGLTSAVFAAIAYTLIRAVKQQESPMTIMLYFTTISTIGSVFFLPFGFVWPSGVTWLFLLGIGIGTFYGQLWMTMAFQQAPASVISPFFYLTPVLSFLYGLLCFGDKLSPISTAGVVLIIVSGSVISFSEAQKSRTLPVNE
ncbi:MAG: DMT family transporter [Candidatus Omnitrophica bacterium]|nr:DMT family transporter [Candidatus Omnitrophota bacterium]